MAMKTRLIVTVLLLLLTTSAHAGAFADEMSKCLVKSTSAAEKTLLIKWIYAAMSAHPEVMALSNVSSAQAEQFNKEMAQFVTRLLTQRCKTETEQALQYEGEAPFKTSFEVLGKVAMIGLMNDPAVGKYLAGFESHIDENAIKGAFESKKPRQGQP